MKIGIVTIYESVSNYGSYLQAYAMKIALEQLGHEIFFIEKTPKEYFVKKYIFKINPKREFFLRLKKCACFLKSYTRLTTIKKDAVNKHQLDAIIYGSDEIWNMNNPYFRDPFFWGEGFDDIPRIAYAITVGNMNNRKMSEHKDIVANIRSFSDILVRDKHTQELIGNFLKKDLFWVCDPTLLIDKTYVTKHAKRIKRKYLLIYSYAVPDEFIPFIKQFAKENNLLVLSLCFWHPFVDKTIVCDPLELSEIIQYAECVFTSTFHGTIFSLLNHKKCCVYSNAEKTHDLLERFQMTDRELFLENNYSDFCQRIQLDFPEERFEKTLVKFREESISKLKEALNKI